MEQYTDDMSEHMVSVGTAPGGGNRSHMAGALSHVDKEICRLPFRDSSNLSPPATVRFSFPPRLILGALSVAE